ncbi:MAG: 2-oxoglutarate dehydrogenase complex dihydrolipoyllysine-residue succinyltransferase [Steroidobacteraceae bacterium]
MTIEIRVPQLPESIADATLVGWHKQPGEQVSRDENLADLETDKVVLEVPAPANGVLRELEVQSGATVTSGQLLAVLEERTAAGKGVAAQPAATSQPTATSQPAVIPAPAAASQPTATAQQIPQGGSAQLPGRLSPSARRLVEENRLVAGEIPATGRDGRVTKADVIGYLEKRSPGAPAGRTEQRVPMTRLRQRIAQRLVEAQSSQALLTTFNEVDLSAVQDLRARYKDRFEKAEGVKLGFMSFFIKASIEALRRFPVINASVDGTDILYHEYYDIGVAVSTDRGLIVPIVRDADAKGFGELEKEIAAYAAKAREGSIAYEDLTGGTFTITNGGVFGSLLSTPIVNAPQSAILGMHKTQERAVVVNGAIVIRPMMYLAVTYDHRIIDGREAVQFLAAVKDCLEDPGRILLGV